MLQSPLMAHGPPDSHVDAVIVGNGPSAMILSYILHGNIPFYNPETPHPDPILHAKLKDATDLLNLDIARLTDHFEASRFSYSTQALPVNVLLDALIRPHGDDDMESDTTILWRYLPEKAVRHTVIGDAIQPGGQWAGCVPGTSRDIQSLSYSGMLSLPGCSFAQHHRRVHGTPLPPFTRPSRQEMAEYLAAYPDAVGISGAFRCGEKIRDVSRTNDGFYIGSHRIKCKSLVLASGVFTEPIPARPLLQPLLSLPPPSLSQPRNKAPLLVIGSGFSAADVIISAPKDQEIIHIFKWSPEKRPSPLKACHYQAYPEYAGVYRLMKRAATQGSADSGHNHPKRRRGFSIPFLENRDWQNIYEGLPNTLVTDVALHGDIATITLRRDDGSTFTCEVSGFAYAVGRRSTLNYLDDSLRAEVLTADVSPEKGELISGQTLREQASEDLEIARNVYIIGSLTGDSLIRFAYGGCMYVAGKIMTSGLERSSHAEASVSEGSGTRSSSRSAPRLMNGMEGHNDIRADDLNKCDSRSDTERDDQKVDAGSGAAKSRRKSWWAYLFSCSK